MRKATLVITILTLFFTVSNAYALDPAAEAEAKALVEQYMKSIVGDDETNLVNIPNESPDPAYNNSIQVMGVEKTTGARIYLTDDHCDIHFNSPSPFNKELIMVPANGTQPQIGCWYRNVYTDEILFVVGDTPGIYDWSYDNFLPVPEGEEVPRPTEVSL